MSIELVSKCLELEDLAEGCSQSKKKKKPKTNNAMQIIKTDRHGVWKELRKERNKQLKQIKAKRKKELFKSAIEKYKDTHDVDFTESNVETLLKISQLGKVRDADAQKILYQQPCRLSRDLKEESKPEKPQSVFTDEDFENFAKAYNPT